MLWYREYRGLLLGSPGHNKSKRTSWGRCPLGEPPEKWMRVKPLELCIGATRHSSISWWPFPNPWHAKHSVTILIRETFPSCNIHDVRPWYCPDVIHVIITPSLIRPCWDSGNAAASKSTFLYTLGISVIFYSCTRTGEEKCYSWSELGAQTYCSCSLTDSGACFFSRCGKVEKVRAQARVPDFMQKERLYSE